MLLPEHIYEEIERNRPHINETSFEHSLSEIEKVDDGRTYAATGGCLFIAAAIHELSNMLNEHFAEMLRCYLEKEEK